MRELLCNNSLFVGQLYEDKSLALRARDLIFFTTDLQTMNYYTKISARADLFLKHKASIFISGIKGQPSFSKKIVPESFLVSISNIIIDYGLKM